MAGALQASCPYHVSWPLSPPMLAEKGERPCPSCPENHPALLPSLQLTSKGRLKPSNSSGAYCIWKSWMENTEPKFSFVYLVFSSIIKTSTINVTIYYDTPGFWVQLWNKKLGFWSNCCWFLFVLLHVLVSLMLFILSSLQPGLVWLPGLKTNKSKGWKFNTIKKGWNSV